MSASLLLTHDYTPAQWPCADCAEDRHQWGNPEDQWCEFLTLRRWWCVCPSCPDCPGLWVAVEPAERWYGQHRIG